MDSSLFGLTRPESLANPTFSEEHEKSSNFDSSFDRHRGTRWYHGGHGALGNLCGRHKAASHPSGCQSSLDRPSTHARFTRC